MSKYTLEILFTPSQLKEIEEAQLKVIVAKPDNNAATPDVAWQAFDPCENNHIKWEEKYGIFASSTSLEHGAELVQTSKVDLVVEGKDYELLPQGYFQANPLPEGIAGSYYTTNGYRQKQSMVMGLFQAAEVNGIEEDANPTSASPILRGSTMQMTPYTNLKVWLQADLAGGCVVRHITSPQASVKFGGNTFVNRLGYDSESGHFLPFVL